MHHDAQIKLGFDPGFHESPKKARIVEKPSIVSTSSSKFGGERMIRAQRGLFERQSLEESCLIAEGEDLTTACKFFFLYTRFSRTDILFSPCYSCVLEAVPYLAFKIQYLYILELRRCFYPATIIFGWFFGF